MFVSLSFSYLPYLETNSFSPLVIDYLSRNDNVRQFYRFDTDLAGITEAINARKQSAVNRDKLVRVLKKQYLSLPTHELVQQNIELLSDENTFTICTAHQPNLLTGYLYFIYKIVHAIKLAEELSHHFPENNFVPVYYMGSEDNDLEELGVFRYNGNKFTWNADNQTGAVGRMNTESLKPLLDQLFKEMGPPGPFCEALKTIITQSYIQHETVAKATQFLVNELFGRFGLIVIDPDDHELKSSFQEIIKDDLLLHTAHSIVSGQIANIAEHYKVQAHPRTINLFYLRDNLRERIEQENDKWRVLNTNIIWSKEELLEELNLHPERFSPNVILRGLFQETILPNIVFIGGGAEVAYWLQLKPLFEYYNIFYPSIHLRQSILWANAKEKRVREQLQLSTRDIFKAENDLLRHYILNNGADDWQTEQETAAIENIFIQLKQKALSLDPSLRSSAEAALVKMKYQLHVLEKKMLRAEKRKLQDSLLKISKLKAHLFPGNGLQERVENFMFYYLQYGNHYFDILKEAIQPLKHEFLIIEEAE